ncbi:HEXXH motif domain-containing protein [Actinoplanes ianthinogenes]|uniref:HEXXH motif domain-containing protein n=1 Tax=Actinoplanes ianthinogenes TaxID=122358 RepID=A0ABN6C7N6_9ACTN|nr:HEXXH motif domain-containing protein [Actinoplanes ianthinogenes]BCJ40512.1 HEXXH motif domain-containing protein [Actinoplanes ianthinogenes]GGR50410.1 HEXXH motif domain-containing protein [Actinoplanes ianthinogenes]
MTANQRDATAALPTHRLPQPDFAGLSNGTGTAEAMRRLATSERSWRLVALRSVREALAADPDATGPLAPVSQAWDLLLSAERASPAGFEAALTYPQTGIWAAHLLRRLRAVVTDPAPLWTDVGYLHLLAAAAAIRAGVDFSITVPVRAGAVVLPGLGHAVLADTPEAGTAEVRRSGPVVEIAAGGQTVRRGGPGWRDLPACAAEHDGARIAVLLDDIDPYRNLRGWSAPAPLPDADVRRWRALLTDAWRLLVEQDRERAEAVAAAMTIVVPLPAAQPYRPLSATCDEAFAAVLASMPDDTEQLAVTMIHETQHVALGALLHLIPLVERNDGARRYAPWRDDPRPVSGLLQGVYAFIGITGFWRHRRHSTDDRTAEFEFALWTVQLRRVLTALTGDPDLTEHGRDLVSGLTVTVGGWAADPVDPRAGRLAALAADDHYGQWRAYHLPVGPTRLDGLLDAWRAGAPQPKPAGVDGLDDPRPVTDTSVRWLDGRAVLARVLLAEPERFARITDRPETVTTEVPGALPPDLDLLAGHPERARDGYLAAIAAAPADPRPWLGLGLALAELGAPDNAAVRRPELVRAMARAFDAAGEEIPALRLIDWLGSY